MSDEDYNQIQETMAETYCNIFNYFADLVRNEGIDGNTINRSAGQCTGLVNESQIRLLLKREFRDLDVNVTKAMVVGQDQNGQYNIVERDIVIFKKDAPLIGSDTLFNDQEKECVVIAAEHVIADIEVKSYADSQNVRKNKEILEKIGLENRGYLVGIGSSGPIENNVFVLSRVSGGIILRGNRNNPPRIYEDILREFVETLRDNIRQI